MGVKTGIEWCDATFNIAWGCQKVSPGCANCYAATLDKRVGGTHWGPDQPRRTFGERHWNQPLKWNAAAQKRGEPATVFCSSMCDIGEDHPTIRQERAKLWPLIKRTPWLIWLLLTKRDDQWHAILPADWSCENYPNVWLGTSVESQDYVHRVSELLEVDAVQHFVSAEPLLGPLDLRRFLGLECVHEDSYRESDTNYHVCKKCDEARLLSWVIVGGESGDGARRMEEKWARDIVEQCREARISCFMKQMGRVYGATHGGDLKGATVIPADINVRQWPGRVRLAAFDACERCMVSAAHGFETDNATVRGCTNPNGCRCVLVHKVPAV